MFLILLDSIDFSLLCVPPKPFTHIFMINTFQNEYQLPIYTVFSLAITPYGAKLLSPSPLYPSLKQCAETFL